MSNGALAFFAITLGTISAALAALLVCMVVQGHSPDMAYRSSPNDHVLSASAIYPSRSLPFAWCFKRLLIQL